MLRFHGAVTTLTDRTLDLLLDLEAGQREAIIAVDDVGIAGVARYARSQTDPSSADVAILVADEWQHRGVAHELMQALISAARHAGIERFRAEILPHNVTARRFFRGLAPTADEHYEGEDAVVIVNLDDVLPQP